jgi:hypothetical protein
MINKKFLYIVLLFCGLSVACTITIFENKKSTSHEKYCIPIPGNFQESDLVGTWKTSYVDDTRSDTIIIHDDGTYDHRFVNSNINYQYDSINNHWTVEIRSSGEAYLHLENMLFCGGSEDTCVDPKTYLGFYDSCEDKYVQMDGEYVLAVIDNKSSAMGIDLETLTPSGWDFYTAIWNLQQPDQ